MLKTLVKLECLLSGIMRVIKAAVLACVGFAVNLQLLLSNPGAKIDPDAQRGYLETSLLEKLVTLDQLEPKGEDCTKVLPSFSPSHFSSLPPSPFLSLHSLFPPSSLLLAVLPSLIFSLFSYLSPSGSCLAHTDRSSENETRGQTNSTGKTF